MPLKVGCLVHPVTVIQPEAVHRARVRGDSTVKDAPMPSRWLIVIVVRAAAHS